MPDRRIAGRYAGALCLIATLVLASACGSSKSSGKPSSAGAASSTTGGGTYKVDIMGDLTGPSALNGGGGVAGIQAGIKEINAAGGVNGNMISVGSPIDTQSTTQGGQTAVQQAIGDNPAAILSSPVSTVFAAQVPLLSTAKIPYITNSVAPSVITPPASWYFGVSATPDQITTYFRGEATQLLGGSLKGKRVALEVIQTPGGEAAMNSVKSALISDGATIVAFEETANASVGSFTSQATNIAGGKPDIVISNDSPNNTILVAKALGVAGYTGPIVGSSAANDDATIQTIGLSNYYAPRLFAAAATGGPIDAAATKYGYSKYAQSSYFTSGYVLAYILKAGLAKCGYPCDSQKLTTALQAVGSVPLPSGVAFGPVTFSSTRNYGLTAVQFYSYDSSAKKVIASKSPVKI